MIRALVEKELREHWWMGLLAALFISNLVVVRMGVEFNEYVLRIERPRNELGVLIVPVPFTDQSLQHCVAFTAAALGLALGLWQTLSESVQGTWLYLLHRPIERRSILLSKLASGLFVLLPSTGLPLLVYLLWAASPGTHPHPFKLWMMRDVFIAWFSGTFCYLAAFLCGLRPARWWGSRLWPLLPVVMMEFLIFAFLPTLSALWGWLIVLSNLVYFGAILFAVEHRDYA